ncbi:MAG: DUF2752 domain-containing protein [Deltaproteobacteria bacterium]|nr:DUF2752 domain-containing protein [Deltaproteobacteria bacterium]
MRILNSFLSWNRPSSYWDVISAHLPFALITGTVLLASILVPVVPSPLKICTFLKLTGYPCPFCGFTRSFLALGHGGWAFAMHNCPLSVLLYCLTIFVFAWNTAGLLAGVIIRRGRFLRLKPVRPWLIIIIGLFALNWMYRLFSGLK